MVEKIIRTFKQKFLYNDCKAQKAAIKMALKICGTYKPLPSLMKCHHRNDWQYQCQVYKIAA